MSQIPSKLLGEIDIILARLKCLHFKMKIQTWWSWWPQTPPYPSDNWSGWCWRCWLVVWRGRGQRVVSFEPLQNTQKYVVWFPPGTCREPHSIPGLLPRRPQWSGPGQGSFAAVRWIGVVPMLWSMSDVTNQQKPELFPFWNIPEHGDRRWWLMAVEGCWADRNRCGWGIGRRVSGVVDCGPMPSWDASTWWSTVKLEKWKKHFWSTIDEIDTVRRVC